MHKNKTAVDAIHSEIIHWLERRGLYYIHSPSDAATGTPCFHVIHQGRAVAITVRDPKTQLTRDQKECIGHLLRSETKVLVVDNGREAFVFINRNFGLE